MSTSGDRAFHEIEHGEYLAKGCTEDIWGWGTPAGKLRLERRARLIGDGAGLGMGSKVLEVGCGTGNFTEEFVSFNSSILACDISESLLKKARSRNLPKERVQFICSRFEDCEIGGPFDAIIGSSVLHHLEIESALEKMFNLLKPYGTFCFAEPNMLNPQIFFQLKFRQFFPQFSPDETAFVRFKLKNLLKKTGFTNIKIIPFDWLHPSTPPSLIPVVSGLGKRLEQLPLIREISGSLLIKAKKNYR